MAIQRPLLCGLFALLLGMAMLGQPLSTQAQENGFYPQASLTQGTNGNFYGTTRDGGDYDFGSLFEITPQGQLTTLYSFSVPGSNSVNSDGAFPTTALTLGSDGNFYGATSLGGANGLGTLFVVTPEGQLTTLHSFAGLADGADPLAAMTLGQDGNFYGVCSWWGPRGGGTIFKLTPKGQFTLLYAFTGGSDGGFPSALTPGSDGNFYGTTRLGGAASCGTAFRISLQGALTTLYSFGGANSGTFPSALAPGRDGNFYGTTSNGGVNGVGAVFMITPSGQYTTLYSCAVGSAQGVNPWAALTLGRDGNFYGTTGSDGAHGSGTIFRITSKGQLTTLCSFPKGSGGKTSAALVLGQNGNFYGTTRQGGRSGGGAVYEVTPQGRLTTLYGFVAGGAGPSRLTSGHDGNYYGATSSGGTNGTGTIFQMTSQGQVTVLYSFHALTGNKTNADGAGGISALIQGNDGSFYGAAQYGGAHGTGTIFKVTSTGELTTLHSFSAVNSAYENSDGAFPSCALTLGEDGNFYGMTLAGGRYNEGTVFKITPQGRFTTLHSFSAVNSSYVNSDGGQPEAALTLGNDGNFYGTTVLGGQAGEGTVFKITPQGSLTTLYSFSALNSKHENSDGINPEAALALGKDGNFYGTTYGGGQANDGTVFKITPQGSLTTLHSFSGSDGSVPGADLTLGNDGNFYGTTEFGGFAYGTIFRITPQGQLTTLYTFLGTPAEPTDGALPYALTLDPDGNFYGTAGSATGPFYGTVFKITPQGQFTALYSFNQ